MWRLFFAVVVVKVFVCFLVLLVFVVSSFVVVVVEVKACETFS